MPSAVKTWPVAATGSASRTTMSASPVRSSGTAALVVGPTATITTLAGAANASENRPSSPVADVSEQTCPVKSSKLVGTQLADTATFAAGAPSEPRTVPVTCSMAG